jgi:hypothetical protein
MQTLEGRAPTRATPWPRSPPWPSAASSTDRRHPGRSPPMLALRTARAYARYLLASLASVAFAMKHN